MKEKIIAALLAVFFGEWGIHKFYLNEQEAGKKYLVWCIIGIVFSLIVVGLIPLIVLTVKKIIDGVDLLFMTDQEFNEKYNSPQRENLND